MTTQDRIHKSYKYIVIGFILLIFLIFSFLDLQESIQFGSDAGRDFLRVWNLYNTKELTLIGPPSQYNINGREFFFGPAPYYTILPALLIGNWSPVLVSYFLILLNAVILLIAICLLWKQHKDKKIVYSFSIITAVTPAFIAYSQSYWNPHFMLPISIILLALLIKSKTSSSRLLFFFIGFLCGLGMQYHYSFIFAVMIGSIWFLISKKITISNCAAIVAGGIVGFAPVIIFELRNNFYNLNTFILALNSSSKTFDGAKLQTFYLISVFPFLIYLISIFLAKVKNNVVFYGILLFYIVFSLASIMSTPKPTLSYPTLEKMTAIIKSDNPSSYNIVDQLTRDNRAMALRYLLTVNEVAPQGVEAYSEVKTLYIYSRLPLQELLRDPVWEIRSFMPYADVKVMNVNDEINIYKLEK